MSRGATNSARNILSARQGARSDCLAPNFHKRVREHRLIDAQPEDKFLDQLADQTRSLVIPVTLGGIRGAITARFIDFRRPFHAGRDTRA